MQVKAVSDCNSTGFDKFFCVSILPGHVRWKADLGDRFAERLGDPPVTGKDAATVLISLIQDEILPLIKAPLRVRRHLGKVAFSHSDHPSRETRPGCLALDGPEQVADFVNEVRKDQLLGEAGRRHFQVRRDACSIGLLPGTVNS